MTTQEFSDQFDILFNNVTSNQAPGINEYEKSVFLTKALNQLVTEYFNNRVDQAGGGFDGSLRRQYDFSSLIKTVVLPVTTIASYNLIDKRSKCFLFPIDYFLAVNEILSDSRYLYNVLPIDYNEYARLMMKPYAYPVKKGAWRLITGRKDSYIVDSQNYNIPVKKDCTLSITYIPLPFYESGTEWYEIELSELAHTGKLVYRDHGEHEVDYPDLETMTSDLVLSLGFSGAYAFEYQEKFYWIIVFADNINLSYSLYLYSWGSTDYTLTDDLVILILHRALVILSENESFARTYNGFLNTVGDLSGASAKSDISDFSKAWSDYSEFPNGESSAGVTFNCKHIIAPLVEVIGRFIGNPDYTLRYIKKPNPIILVNLIENGYENLSIDGMEEKSECELPEETHQEILERAVTLAKIAWQGGTMTQAAAESNSRRNNNND